jgi:hypothetical protein
MEPPPGRDVERPAGTIPPGSALCPGCQRQHDNPGPSGSVFCPCGFILDGFEPGRPGKPGAFRLYAAGAARAEADTEQADRRRRRAELAERLLVALAGNPAACGSMTPIADVTGRAVAMADALIRDIEAMP